ncbi:MAG: DUF1178 family protein, partial [Hyphomicrobiaceae bacterium]
SSVAYDRQAKRGLVACPRCGSTEITKALMAPNVKNSGEKRRRTRIAATSEPAPASDTALSPPQTTHASMPTSRKEFIKLMEKVRDHVEKNAEYVGPRFAEEARKIHYEETPARGIYGEATREEVKELGEEGIEVYPIPALPKDKN